MNTQKIVVMVGISGSGKSTLAAEKYIDCRPSEYIIISRDSLRMSMYGYTEENLFRYYRLKDHKEREDIITKMMNNQIWTALENGFSVVADNTHLRKGYIKSYFQFGVEVDLEVVDCSVGQAIERDFLRSKRVGVGIIQKQQKDFEGLMGYGANIFNEVDIHNLEVRSLMETCKKAAWDCWKRDVILFDIDGTLALKGNRGTFDYSKVAEDDRNNDIANLHTTLEPEIDVIVCTGREGTDICKQETFYWLKFNGLNYKRIHFRGAGDMRKDFIVKAEMWREIQKEFNIIAMFDDRKQVVNFARKLGYTVCQVADGNF
jgi:predicted kinase